MPKEKYLQVFLLWPESEPVPRSKGRHWPWFSRGWMLVSARHVRHSGKTHSFCPASCSVCVYDTHAQKVYVTVWIQVKPHVPSISAGVGLHTEPWASWCLHHLSRAIVPAPWCSALDTLRRTIVCSLAILWLAVVRLSAYSGSGQPPSVASPPLITGQIENHTKIIQTRGWKKGWIESLRRIKS